MFLTRLKRRIGTSKYLEDLSEREIEVLVVVGEECYQDIMIESDDMIGQQRARHIMKATTWKQHVKCLRNINKKRANVL